MPEFKDEEIGKIILSALPNLRYHSDVKRKIIDLAKGNPRVALMATYSVTPDSETNYLSSPVLLYEKYFKKISAEIGIFDNPIILKSLTIVSFFGVVDRNNNELKKILSTKFGIDWNELWTAIMKLHNSEILDVYAGEIVKVSDQVLATYSFYSCFIDNESAVINYSDWISTFLEKFSYRLRITLIDANNTFDYYHIKDLVLPHLDSVLKNIVSDEELFSFYNLFWFYKGLDCLVYLKKWIVNLNQEQHPESIQFNFVHNDNTKASEHFELLRGFWNHPNELLKPSIQLTLQLLERQPSRLSEILKFIHDDFKYKIADLEDEYLRQNILFDVLLNEDLSNTQRLFANGIFLSLAELLLGWHYTEFGSGKGRTYTIYNFNLSKSDALLKLRKRILVQIYNHFDSNNEFSQKILRQIVYPGGDIDKSIYLEELSVYQSIISEKLDKNQYAHCKFVSVLAKHLTQVEIKYPESWKEFIESDIRKLYKLLQPIRVDREGQSIENTEKKKRAKYDSFIESENWNGIEKFLGDIDELYRQLRDNDGWNIEWAVTDIFIFIARKDRNEFENSLRLYFSGKILIPLSVNIIGVVLHESIMAGEELLRIMEDYEFQGKSYWKSILLAMLPQDQINELFLHNLIEVFQIPDERVYTYRMIDYIKYETVFNALKNRNLKLYNHNIITYLTSIILAKKTKTSNIFGFDFCVECASYFKNDFNLLKEAYWEQYKNNSHFDYEGNELKSILDIDKSFISDSLRNEKIGLGYSSSVRLEYFNTDLLWEYDEYEELIENLLITILEKEKYTYMAEEDINSVFIFRNADDSRTEKVKSLITKLTKKHWNDEKVSLMLVEVVYHNFRDWFVEYFRDFLILNDNIEITKKISFDRSASTSGSWVPVYQKKIDFYQDILNMIKSLPNILEYSDHIDYFEQKISWKKKDIAREQKRDFMDEFY